MTISGAGSLYSSATDSASPLAALLAQNTHSDTPAAYGTTATTASTSTRISGPGRLMAKLQQLQQTDPAKFKQVMSDMAAKLNALAQQQSGSSASSSSTGGGQSLTDLANKFASAAQTGDLSAFQPPPLPTGTSAANAAGAYAQNGAGGASLSGVSSGHHHHHHGGVLATSGTDASSSSDSASASSQDPLASLFSQLNQEVSSALQATTSGTTDSSDATSTGATNDLFQLPSEVAV